MTGRMSYVDLAWPWGLVTLGLQPLLSPAPGQVADLIGPILWICLPWISI